jgi:hypothetical protein
MPDLLVVVWNFSGGSPGTHVMAHGTFKHIKVTLSALFTFA